MTLVYLLAMFLKSPQVLVQIEKFLHGEQGKSLRVYP